MKTVEALALRTNAALGRLATVQRQVDQLPEGQRPAAQRAVKELRTAIEELQVANEQLETYITELAAARHDAVGIESRHDEFVNRLPLACAWTDARGGVLEANEAAALLLNVPARRLEGKPLTVFFSDRARFFEGLESLSDGRVPILEIALQVRPRERRPRTMRVTGQRLEHDPRVLWFLREEPSAPLSAPSAEA